MKIVEHEYATVVWTTQLEGTHLSKVLLLFLLLCKLWSHGTMQPCQSLSNAWGLLGRDLPHSFTLFVFQRGEPRVDESAIREQSTGMYEAQTSPLQLRSCISDLTVAPMQLASCSKAPGCVKYLLFHVLDGVLLSNMHDQIRPTLRKPDRQVPRSRLGA